MRTQLRMLAWGDAPVRCSGDSPRAAVQDVSVRTHVGLLRGVNVGGRNLLSMADLRGAATAAGFADVATILQSGNIVFSTADDDAARIAVALERAIADHADVRPAVVVVSRRTLRDVVNGNPFPQELDPKHVHVGFYRDVPDAAVSGAASSLRS